jgi:hypothetical protein
MTALLNIEDMKKGFSSQDNYGGERPTSAG